MGAYHQLGHDSANLVLNTSCGNYSGVILSPVNNCEEKTHRYVLKWQSEGLDCILDPQLYVPTSGRGKLATWEYFPSDVDTADVSSLAWWEPVSRKLIDAANRMTVSTLATPCVLTSNQFSNEYYQHLVAIGEIVRRETAGQIGVLLSVPVSWAELDSPERVKEIASIISRTKCDGFYLILNTGVKGRRELQEEERLTQFGLLITLLSGIRDRVLVGYCGAEGMLWRHAGATGIATGKFWNLRRFSPARFLDAEERGGGQLPYWFEPSLAAHLREADYLRLDQAGLIPEVSKSTKAAAAILTQRGTDPSKAWVGLGWRHYLACFSDIGTGRYLGNRTIDAYLQSVEEAWTKIESLDLLLDEPRNDGSWVRQWRIAARNITKAKT